MLPNFGDAIWADILLDLWFVGRQIRVKVITVKFTLIPQKRPHFKDTIPFLFNAGYKLCGARCRPLSPDRPNKGQCTREICWITPFFLFYKIFPKGKFISSFCVLEPWLSFRNCHVLSLYGIFLFHEINWYHYCLRDQDKNKENLSPFTVPQWWSLSVLHRRNILVNHWGFATKSYFRFPYWSSDV